MENITSKLNKKVKFIKSLNENKYRKETKKYYIEGVKVVNELLDIYNEKAIDIVSIAYSYNILINTNGGIEILKRLEKFKNIEVINISEEIFNSITDTVTTQGILAVLNIPNYSINDLDTNSNMLLLDKVQDAGNVGTIIRTAISFGIKNIICVEGTTDIYSQKVLRSTMSAIFKVKVLFIKENNLNYEIDKIKKLGYTIIGTSLKTDEYITSKIFNQKCVIAVGNESNGLSDVILKKCDQLIKIPINNEIESLNVACATSIILYEQFKKLK